MGATSQSCKRHFVASDRMSGPLVLTTFPLALLQCSLSLGCRVMLWMCPSGLGNPLPPVLCLCEHSLYKERGCVFRAVGHSQFKASFS